MALPKLIMVREDKQNDGEVYLVAGRNPQEAMEDDYEPQVIGTYKLVGKRTLKLSPIPQTLKVHKVRA